MGHPSKRTAACYLTWVVDESARSRAGFLSYQAPGWAGGSHSAKLAGANSVLAPAPNTLLNGSMPAPTNGGFGHSLCQKLLMTCESSLTVISKPGCMTPRREGFKGACIHALGRRQRGGGRTGFHRQSLAQVGHIGQQLCSTGYTTLQANRQTGH